MPVENLRTPVGRIVWGNPAKSQVKRDQQTKQPVLKDGKPVDQWAFGVAFTKQDFNAYLKPYFDQEAATAYPQGVPPQFSWKYKDGDGVDKQGKPYSTREGYAGHIVLTVSTEAFAPPIFKHVNGAYYQCAPEEIKTGDFVVLSLNLKVNVPQNRTHTPGIYVNPNGVELVAQGQAIMQTSDPTEMFGGQQYQLPPGATPLGAAPPSPAHAQPGPGGYQQPPAGAPPAYGQQPPQYGQPPAPGYGQAPPAGYSAPPPAAPAYGQAQPGYPAQVPPQQMPPPHQQFVQPQAQPGYPQQQQPPAPGYPAQPQYQQPPAGAPPAYGQQPGMMPPR